ncbi:hypothetical protein HDU76_010898 [Blyttiomyces sp. JEL0837]|nr:hypothetical protein HDU76_010898 [Blyttiomyces sp. JEL0837]
MIVKPESSMVQSSGGIPPIPHGVKSSTTTSRPILGAIPHVVDNAHDHTTKDGASFHQSKTQYDNGSGSNGFRFVPAGSSHPQFDKENLQSNIASSSSSSKFIPTSQPVLLLSPWQTKINNTPIRLPTRTNQTTPAVIISVGVVQLQTVLPTTAPTPTTTLTLPTLTLRTPTAITPTLPTTTPTLATTTPTPTTTPTLAATTPTPTTTLTPTVPTLTPTTPTIPTMTATPLLIITMEDL